MAKKRNILLQKDNPSTLRYRRIQVRKKFKTQGIEHLRIAKPKIRPQNANQN